MKALNDKLYDATGTLRKTALCGNLTYTLFAKGLFYNCWILTFLRPVIMGKHKKQKIFFFLDFYKIFFCDPIRDPVSDPVCDPSVIRSVIRSVTRSRFCQCCTLQISHCISWQSVIIYMAFCGMTAILPKCRNENFHDNDNRLK